MTKRNETLKMAEMFRRGLTMRQIGEQFGISRQTVQQRLAATGITARDRPVKGAPHTLIDKERLEALYREKLSLKNIAGEFGAGVEIIRQALAFHQTPKRDWIRTGGSRADVLRRMEIGDQCEMVFARKKLYSHIYKLAKRLGIKVSIRLHGPGKIEITRTG